MAVMAAMMMTAAAVIAVESAVTIMIGDDPID
jgi:hypothetical protein